GPAYATQFIERFGFPSQNLPRNLSLALGTSQVSPLEMASAYAVFANGGFQVEPYVVQRILGPDGSAVFEAQPRFACLDCVTTNQAASTQTASDATSRALSSLFQQAPAPVVET